MDLNRIHESYKAEMIGAFALLRDDVEDGLLSPKQFLSAQERLFLAYCQASAQRFAQNLSLVYLAKS